MNARVEFVLSNIKSNFQSFVLGWGITSFILIPIIAMTIFGVKRELITLTLLTSLAYWAGVVLYYSWKAKKEVK
jgi:hypothetical protein